MKKSPKKKIKFRKGREPIDSMHGAKSAKDDREARALIHRARTTILYEYLRP